MLGMPANRTMRGRVSLDDEGHILTGHTPAPMMIQLFHIPLRRPFSLGKSRMGLSAPDLAIVHLRVIHLDCRDKPRQAVPGSACERLPATDQRKIKWSVKLRRIIVRFAPFSAATKPERGKASHERTALIQIGLQGLAASDLRTLTVSQTSAKMHSRA
jgi:hypothetical protein